ncbi:MAG: type II toxin-antitoxin system Phd/YefM family antitoxin [bacterium]
MNSTYSITEAQSRLPKLVKDAQRSNLVAITRHDKTVAYLISSDRLQAIVETLEIMANPQAMKAIRDYEQGKTKLLPFHAIDKD